MKEKIIVILGPTATGKSNLGVKIAKKINGEIISADSRQIYKGLDLGSGKITKKEMKNVPHYMLDIISPKNTFTVYQFIRKGEKIIKDILKKEKIPIIVGGTGFYIDTLVYGIEFPKVKENKKLRKELSSKSLEELQRIIKKLDKDRYEKIDLNNKVRLIRAIEIAKEFGKVPKIKKEQKYNPVFIGLDFSDNILKDRIKKRLKERIKQGMIEEVLNLHKDGLSWKRLESLGLEYKYISLFLQNKISKKELVEILENKIWQFVKRQRTWFKKDENIKWFINKQPLTEIIKFCKNP